MEAAERRLAINICYADVWQKEKGFLIVVEIAGAEI